MNTTCFPTSQTPKMSRENNMDAVRYLLALSVIIAHMNGLMGFDLPWPIASYVGVGGFFALSGFLVFGSYLRQGSLTLYLRRRARRIMPPYLTVVVLCAVGMVFISSLSAKDYFTSPEWWKYLLANLSFMNFLNPTLPGVFEGYAQPAVNGSLWTMKVEWMLYFSVPITVWVCNRLRWNHAHTAVGIYLLSVVYRLIFNHLYHVTGNEFIYTLSQQVFGQLAFFYAGVWIYFRREQFMKYRHPLALVAVLLFFLRHHIPYYEQALEPAVISILVLYASLNGRWGVGLSRVENVSYEMYLFHFPVVQLAVYWGVPSLGKWASLAIVLILTTALACGCKRWTHLISGRTLP